MISDPSFLSRSVSGASHPLAPLFGLERTTAQSSSGVGWYRLCPRHRREPLVPSPAPSSSQAVAWVPARRGVFVLCHGRQSCAGHPLARLERELQKRALVGSRTLHDPHRAGHHACIHIFRDVAHHDTAVLQLSNSIHRGPCLPQHKITTQAPFGPIPHCPSNTQPRESRTGDLSSPPAWGRRFGRQQRVGL